MRVKIPELVRALHGRFATHHARLRRLHLDHIDHLDPAISSSEMTWNTRTPVSPMSPSVVSPARQPLSSHRPPNEGYGR